MKKNKLNKFSEFISIKRRDDNACYVIFCQRCDTITYAVSGKGAMSFRDSARLARKHIC